MSVANNIRIRAVLNELQPPINTITSTTPLVVRGNAFAVQVGVFRRDTVVDLSGPMTAHLRLMSVSSTGQAPTATDPDPVLLYWDETSAIENDLTAATWRDGTQQHLSFAIDAAKSAVPVGMWWAVCWLESAAGRTTLFAGRIQFANDGTTAGNIEAPAPLQVLRDAAVAAAAVTTADREAVQLLRNETEGFRNTVNTQHTEVKDWRDEVEWMRGNVTQMASQVQQTATDIGDLDTALTQANADANRSEAAASTAEEERWAAAAYAAMLNPQTKLAAGGIYKDPTGSIILDQPVTLGTTDFDIFVVASNVTRAQTQQDALLTTPTDERALVSYSPSTGTWYVRDHMGTVRLSAVSPIPSEALVRLSRAGGTLTLTIDNEPVAEASGLAAVDFGEFRFVGCRNLAGTGYGWQGTLRNLCVFNRALDAQEAASLTGSGGQIIPVGARSGRAAPLYTSDFSANVDGWTAAFAGAQLSVVAGVLVVESVDGASPVVDHAMPEPIQIGQTYRVTMDVLIPAATVSMIRVETRPQNAGTPRPVVLSGSGLARDVWHPAALTYVFASSAANTAFFRLVFASPSAAPIAVGDTIHLRNIRIERVGCVLDLPFSDGAGYQGYEKSESANRALFSAIGCAHLLPRREFEFVWTRVSSGFLGDADRPVLPAGAVIDSIIWEDAKATRTTASLGFNASNTATHIAAYTPAQARQYATLAAGSLAAADRRLYLHMSAAAGAVTLRVRGHVL